MDSTAHHPTLPPPDSPAQPPCKSFLNLPSEVRIIIYDLVLSTETGCIDPTYSTYAAPKPQGLGLLRVNRQISTEAASRLYGINTFIFGAYMYFEEEGPVGTNVTENSYLLSWLRQVGHNALHVQRIEVEINPLDPEDVDVAMVELTALTPLVPNLRFLTLYYVPDEDEIHMRSSTRDAWLTIPWSQDLIRKLRKFLDAEFRQVEVVRLKHHLPMDSETGR